MVEKTCFRMGLAIPLMGPFEFTNRIFRIDYLIFDRKFVHEFAYIDFKCITTPFPILINIEFLVNSHVEKLKLDHSFNL